MEQMELSARERPRNTCDQVLIPTEIVYVVQLRTLLDLDRPL